MYSLFDAMEISPVYSRAIRDTMFLSVARFATDDDYG